MKRREVEDMNKLSVAEDLAAGVEVFQASLLSLSLGCLTESPGLK